MYLKTIGILGGGQLAKMLTLSAIPLGIKTLCIDPNPEACAKDVTEVITAELTDQASIARFLSSVDLITYETENIPLSSTQEIIHPHSLFPSIDALRISQDRLLEKEFFRSLQIPTAPFTKIASENDLLQAITEWSFPVVLKTRQMGYDGKGQFIIKNKEDIHSAWLNLKNQSLILEGFVDFEYEVSLISVRNKAGQILFYPLTLNHHAHGILRFSEAPFEQAELQRQAQRFATQILEALNYVGVLTIEFFYHQHSLIANEMAPRVHNSGHWTIEGAKTSQFENHLRAICDLPLGSTDPNGLAFMVNCIGSMPAIESCLAIDGVHYHQYGKNPRPGRKLGHLTLVETDTTQYLESKQKLLTVV